MFFSIEWFFKSSDCVAGFNSINKLETVFFKFHFYYLNSSALSSTLKKIIKLLESFNNEYQLRISVEKAKIKMSKSKLLLI